jgi:hypothetical protein
MSIQNRRWCSCPSLSGGTVGAVVRTVAPGGWTSSGSVAADTTASLRLTTDRAADRGTERAHAVSLPPVHVRRSRASAGTEARPGIGHGSWTGSGTLLTCAVFLLWRVLTRCGLFVPERTLYLVLGPFMPGIPIPIPLLCICVIWSGAVGHPGVGLDSPSMHPSRVQQAPSMERLPWPPAGLLTAWYERSWHCRRHTRTCGTLGTVRPCSHCAWCGCGRRWWWWCWSGSGPGAGWTAPRHGVPRVGAAAVLFSLDHHHEYYSNVVTGVSVWTLPPGITPPPRSLVDAVRRRAIAGPAPAAAAAAAAAATAGRL